MLLLDQLPDDVLVMVLQCVTVKDLLSCRLVCKRLKDLATHSDTWRLRTFGYDTLEDAPCLGVVLKLAPCVKRMVYTGRSHTVEFALTRCGATSLHLYVTSGSNLSDYVVVLMNQQRLGRLRFLTVRSHIYATAEHRYTHADLLLRTVLAASANLQSLTVDSSCVPNVTSLALTRNVPPLIDGSIKSFRSDLDAVTDRFICAVLEMHADTLHAVALSIKKREESSNVLMSLKVLARLPQLRRLSSCIFNGLDAVIVSCRLLTELHIHLDHTDVEQAAEMFRQTSAGQIKALSVVMYDLGTVHIDAEKTILQSLNLPGLKCLTLINFKDSSVIVSVPTLMPSLRDLTLIVNILPNQCDGKVLARTLLVGYTSIMAPAGLRSFKMIDGRRVRWHVSYE